MSARSSPTVAIEKFGFKKKAQTGNLVSESLSPDGVSGSTETEEYVAPDAKPANQQEGDGEYSIQGKKVDKIAFKDYLYDRDNAQAIFDGQVDISVINDPEMQDFAEKQVQSRETNDVWDSLKSGAITLATGALGADQMMGDFIEDLTGISPEVYQAIKIAAPAVGFFENVDREDDIKYLQEKAKEAQEARFQADGDFVDLIKEGNFSEAGNMAVNTTVESAPLSLVAAGATMATGNPMVGFAVLTPITTGMTYADQMTSEDKAIQNLSNTQKYLRATAFGLAEAGSEAISGKILGRSFSLFGKGVKDMVGSVLAEAGEEAARETASAAAKKTISEIMKNYGFDILEEGFGEGLTQVAQNLTDAFLGIREMSLDQVLEGVGNAMALGAASGGIMSTPGLAGQTASNLSKKVLDYKLSKKNGAVELTEDAKRFAALNEELAKRLEETEANIESRNEAVQATPEDMVSNTEIVDLIEEKKSLEKQIKGKDPALTSNQKARVDEINQELKKQAESVKEEVTLEEKAAQEVSDYIETSVSNLRMDQKVNPVLDRANNAEEINETELDEAIDGLFEEIDNVAEKDISDAAKESIITELYQSAETLDNYEFTTETRTKKVTKSRAVKNLGAFAEKVPVEKYFDNAAGIIDDAGSASKFTTDKGVVKATKSDGTEFILDTPSMDVSDIVFDENDVLKNVTVTDRSGTKVTFTGETAMDLAIRNRANKIGTVPESALFNIIEEVKLETIEVLKEQADDTQVTEQERLDSEEQRRQEETRDVSKQEESRRKREADKLLQKQKEVEDKEFERERVKEFLEEQKVVAQEPVSELEKEKLDTEAESTPLVEETQIDDKVAEEKLQKEEPTLTKEKEVTEEVDEAQDVSKEIEEVKASINSSVITPKERDILKKAAEKAKMAVEDFVFEVASGTYDASARLVEIAKKIVGKLKEIEEVKASINSSVITPKERDILKKAAEKAKMAVEDFVFEVASGTYDASARLVEIAKKIVGKLKETNYSIISQQEKDALKKAAEKAKMAVEDFVLAVASGTYDASEKIIEIAKKIVEASLQSISNISRSVNEQAGKVGFVKDLIAESISKKERSDIAQEEGIQESEVDAAVENEIINQINDKSIKEPKTLLQRIASKIKKALLALMIVANTANISGVDAPTAESKAYDNIKIENLQSFDKMYIDQEAVNKKNNIDIIKSSQSNKNENYIIVDKSTGSAHLFKGENLINSYEVGVGKNPGDIETKLKSIYIDSKTGKQVPIAVATKLDDKGIRYIKSGYSSRTNWNAGTKTTGAGIFTINNVGKYKGKDAFYLNTEQGISTEMALHKPSNVHRSRLLSDGNPDNNRITNGCINFQYADLSDLVKRGLTSGNNVYVLPDNPNNVFKLVDGKLRFESANPKVNRTTASTKPFQAQPITLKAKGIVSQPSKEFIVGISENKADIMSLYPAISNDIYNRIAKVAYGIFGQESSFGTYSGPRGKLGEIKDKLQSELEGVGFEEVTVLGKQIKASDPSVGVTQIRFSSVNQKVKEKFGIRNTKDLFDMNKSSAATMSVLLDIYTNEIPSNIKEDFERLLPLAWSNRTEFAKAKKGDDSAFNNRYIQKVSNNADKLDVYMGENPIEKPSKKEDSKESEDSTGLMALPLVPVGLRRKRKKSAFNKGKKEVTDVKEGTITTQNPIKIYKGMFGKRNPDGTVRSAHPDVKGSFGAVDKKLATRYTKEDAPVEFDIPAGVTVEVVNVPKGQGVSKVRAAETKAINESDAQIVKLITVDARGREEQFIIKDRSLIEEAPKAKPAESDFIKKRKQKAIESFYEGKEDIDRKEEIGEFDSEDATKETQKLLINSLHEYFGDKYFELNGKSVRIADHAQGTIHHSPSDFSFVVKTQFTKNTGIDDIINYYEDIQDAIDIILDRVEGKASVPRFKKGDPIDWQDTPEMSMKDSPIVKRKLGLADKAKQLLEGKITNKDWREAVKEFNKINPINTFFKAVSEGHAQRALGKKSEKLFAKLVDDTGKNLKRVALRLDIPSYKNLNAWIVSIHNAEGKTQDDPDGKVVSYMPAARIKNVSFATRPFIALRIAAGLAGKSTFARMIGDPVEIPGETFDEVGKNAEKMMEEIVNDKEWTQIGMNPFRHSYFYERTTGDPIVSAEEVIQVGGNVYAKNVKKSNWNKGVFQVLKGRDKDPIYDLEGEVVYFNKEGKKKPLETVDAVLEEMRDVDLINKGVEVGKNRSTDKKINVKQLNKRVAKPYKTVKWEDFEGLPFIFTITDSLTTGNTKNPNTGNIIKKLFGGIGFTNSKQNLDKNAWASASITVSQRYINDALNVYEKYKGELEEFWANNPDYSGLVPMAVVKMGADGIASNEALFRVANDNIIKHIPKKNRENALNVLVDNFNARINTLKQAVESKKSLKGDPLNESNKDSYEEEISQKQAVLDLVKKSKFTRIDQLISDIDKLPLSYRTQVSNSVLYGNFKPKKTDTPGTPSKPVAVALLEGLDDSARKFINVKNVSEIIEEKSFDDIPPSHIVSIVGVDVINPAINLTPDGKKLVRDEIRKVKQKAKKKGKKPNVEALENILENAGTATHPNYPLAVAGKSIGILESPVHMADAFSEAYANALKEVTKSEAKQKEITETTALFQGIPTQIGLPNIVFKGAIARSKSDDVKRLVSFANLAFPSATVFTSQNSWDRILKAPNVKKRIKNGETVYGITVSGDIYLNPKFNEFNTPIHEYGHLWVDMIENDNPALYKKGSNLVKQTDQYKRNLKAFEAEYGEGSKAEQEAIIETMAELIGDRGESIANESLRQNWKDWLLGLWKYLQSKFPNLNTLTVPQIEELTLDQFLGGALRDILSGEQVTFKKSNKKTPMKRSIQKADKEYFMALIEKGLNQEDPLDLNAMYDVLKERIQKETKDPAEKAQQLVDLNNAVSEFTKRPLKGQKAPSELQEKLGVEYKDNKVSVNKKKLTSWINESFRKGYSTGKADAKVNAADIKKVKDKIATDIKALMREMTGKQMIKASKSNAITNRFTKTNLINPQSVQRFVQYFDGILTKADYETNIKAANALRKKIRRRSKDKEIDAILNDIANNFVKIDPNTLDDIQQYISVANAVAEGIRFSKAGKEGIDWRSAFKADKVSEYVDNILEDQKIEALIRLEEKFIDMFGIDPKGDFTAKQIKEALKSIDDPALTREKHDKIRTEAVDVFNSYKAIIESILDTRTDPFSFPREDIESVDKRKEKLIREFINMDPRKLDVRDLIKAVDSLNNFVVNQTTSGIEKKLKVYQGNIAAQNLENDGIKAIPIRLFGSKFVGRAITENISALGIMVEQMFPGQRKALKVLRESGINAITQGKASAQTQSSKIVDSFVNKFYPKTSILSRSVKKKVNGEAFDTAKNVTERGVIAFMKRSTLDPDKAVDEFNRRKKLLKENYEILEKSGSDYKEMAKLYRDAYEKLIEGSNNLSDVESKADKTNVEAVDWWIAEFNEILPELQDVSLNVYNTQLDIEKNYNPDVYRTIKGEDTKEVDFDKEGSFQSYLLPTYDNKNPMLIKVVRPQRMPAKKFISLDFDLNNSNAYEAALIDVRTAADIQKLTGFVNSPSFEKIIESSDDRTLFKNRANQYIRNIRNKNTPGEPYGRRFQKLTELSSRIGVATSLGGVTQAIKQTFSVYFNTAINAGTFDLNLSKVFDKDVLDAIQNSGMSIANRGLMSQSSLESLDRKTQKMAALKGSKLLDAIKAQQDFWLKNFLQNPDVWIAKASFITYYQKELKRMGKEPVTDWKNHEWNKEAAEYAQQMVDRQQNVSDSDLQGTFLSSKNPWVSMSRKVLIPFMNFVLNQKSRMYADLTAVTNKTTSQEDRVAAAKSLSGLVVEFAAFQVLSIAITELTKLAADWLLGKLGFGEEEDKDEVEKKMQEELNSKKWWNQIAKRISSAAVTDLIAPLPITEDILKAGINMSIEALQEEPKKLSQEYNEKQEALLNKEKKAELALEYLKKVIYSQMDQFPESSKMQLKEYEKLRKSMEDGARWTKIKSDAEKAMRKYEQPEIPFFLYERQYENITSNLGLYGMGIEGGPLSIREGADLFDGEFETEYMGRKVKKKIEDPDGNLPLAVGTIVGLQFLGSISVSPAEGTKIAKYMMKNLKKRGKTKSQIEAKRKEDIISHIQSKRPEAEEKQIARYYGTLEKNAKMQYGKTLIDLNNKEFKKVDRISEYY